MPHYFTLAAASPQGRLRREALAQRKRANKAELDLKKLERSAGHKALDVAALKAALKERDGQLHDAATRIKQLEDALNR